MNSNSEEHAGVAPAEALHALGQQWIPDTSEQDEDDVLPSFCDIKNKTMRDLYGVGGNDKSPKGSVDVAIKKLVDLINLHPSFATLSSCSGRIALFDPHTKQQQYTLDDELTEDSGIVERSGKGHGGWLLASHTEVKPSLLVDLLNEPGGQATLIFKHEPLLLHVAASSLTRGRQLLSLALQLGFRESGLVVSSNRVTVAIRGHSLALCVPLARQGRSRPSNDYLENLIHEANVRMRSNQEKLQFLHGTVQETLFRPAPKALTATVETLPPLNLWGHATVAVPVGSDYDVDVLVFGGYGEGPDLNEKAQNGNRCCRSNNTYSLRRRGGVFEDQWREVEQGILTDDDKKTPFKSNLGVEVIPVDFSPREGLDACLLPTQGAAHMPVVALYGGRASPGKPFNDLFLYPVAPNSSFVWPLNVRGELPEARWGHSLTALSGKDGLMAVLVGGRNEHTTFGAIHVLTLVINESGTSHFHWAKLDLGLPARFNHATANADDSIIVFGGLSDANDLLESFSHTYRSSGSKTYSNPGISAFDVDSQGVIVWGEVDAGEESINDMGRLISGASCVLTTQDTSGANKTIVALTGGVSATESGPIQWCEIVTAENNVAFVPRHDIEIDSADETVDFGSMVHHCCVALPSPADCAEMILIGGGVSSFAFGPSFAE